MTIFAILGSILAGCAPMVLTDFTAIYISRLLLGFFFGLYTPLIVVLLSRFYEGDQLANMVGYENVVGSVGSAICSLVSGYLVSMGWQAGFSIYLLSVIPLVLFTLFVKLDDEPAQATQDETASAAQSAEKGRIPMAVIGLAAFLFCFFIFQLPMAYALGNRVFESGVAGTTQADSIYKCYSMTKLFTSVCCFTLVEDGTIALDDPVAKYLPEFENHLVYNPRARLRSRRRRSPSSTCST